MGRDKALLVVDGRPLALRVADVLAAAGCAPVVLVGNQPGLRTLGLPVLREPPGPPHPLRGLAVALETMGDTVVAPCDLVSLSTDHIAALLRHGGPCVAEADGALQPLLGRFGLEQASSAREIARAGGTARAWCTGLARVALDARASRNVNTPDALAAWLAEIR